MTDIDYLRECFSYDPDTGILVWKERPLHHFTRLRDMKCQHARYAGKPAGTIEKQGYVQVFLRYRQQLARRMAWAIHYGNFPSMFLDHINGVKSDNRIINLRQCDYTQNAYNRTKTKACSSGYKGVSATKNGNRWKSQINGARGLFYLGTFDSPEKAHAAYCAAAERLHGEFANHG